MTTNESLIAALAEFAAEIATDLQNLSTKAAAFSQRLQAVETTVQETKPKKAPKKAVKAPEPEPEPQPEVEAAPTLTLEDVRASLAAVVKNGGSAQVRDALAAMGVSKLSDLDPSRFGELLEAVNA